MKIIKSLIAFLFLSTALLGQEQTFVKEIYVTYGNNLLSFKDNEERQLQLRPNNYYIAQWPVNLLKPGFAEVPRSKKSFLFSKGIVTAGFNIYKGRHVFGGLLSYESQHMIHKTSHFFFDLESGESILLRLDPWSESIINNFGLAARYDYNWLDRKKLKLYSGVSAGLQIRHSKTTYYEVSDFQDKFPEVLEDFLRYRETEPSYHLQINAIGLRYGTTWAVIAELGMGHRGYINIGIGRRLGNAVAK